MDSNDISLSYSANFLDLEHSNQVKTQWCEQRQSQSGQSAICHKLMNSNLSKKGPIFKDVIRKFNSEKIKASKSVSIRKGKNEYLYWPWVLQHSGYCQKNAVDTCPGTIERCEQYHNENLMEL